MARSMIGRRSPEPEPADDFEELELEGHKRAIATYYEECWKDYRYFWLNRSNLAMHFGYWDESVTTHSQSLVRTNEVMADWADIKPGERVLDAGCGVGGSCMWLAEHRGATAVGVTITADQVRRGRRYARERGLEDRVELYQRDYRDTGLDAESFDVVWACESAAHAPDQREFLREAFRVLKPGGRLISRDLYMRRPPANAEEEGLMRTWEAAWALPNLPSHEQFLGMLGECGFEVDRHKDVTSTAVRSGRRLYYMSLAALPLESFLLRIGVRNEVQHRNLTGSIAGWRGYKLGLWRAVHTLSHKPQPQPKPKPQRSRRTTAQKDTDAQK
jgi:cyclopropane fatty-acyl-phospholipid synthase-like methyltransferase